MIAIVRAEYTAMQDLFRAWDADGIAYTVRRWSSHGPLLVYPAGQSHGSLGTLTTRELNVALGIV